MRLAPLSLDPGSARPGAAAPVDDARPGAVGALSDVEPWSSPWSPLTERISGGCPQLGDRDHGASKPQTP